MIKTFSKVAKDDTKVMLDTSKERIKVSPDVRSKVATDTQDAQNKDIQATASAIEANEKSELKGGTIKVAKKTADGRDFVKDENW